MFKKIFLSMFLLCFFCFSESELKFNCSFDDVEGNKVKAGNLVGEMKGGKIVEGKEGQGIYLDGKERGCECVVFPETRGDKFYQTFEDGPFTISVWIKPDGTKEYRQHQEILNTGSDRGPGWRLTYTWRMLIFMSGTGEKCWNVPTNPSIDKVNNDEWNNVVVVKDEKGILSLWLNAKKVGESKEEFKIIDGNSPITIGAFKSGYAYGFKGIIDEVKIYKGSLSADEILRQYKEKTASTKIKLDGKIEEEIWQKAKRFTNFYQISSDKLVPVQTDVLFNYDEENLYFAFICNEPKID
ncbi:MAG TPA: hypothetical protein P5150_09980, partial [Candidatus Ratteibacteria bacterium]|nr:hypothetical protein [Candidatus Ratteibacteria bacterium]